MNHVCIQPHPAASTVVAPGPRVCHGVAVVGRSRVSASPCLLSLASGILMAGCFQPFNLHFVAWIALVPWLVVMRRLPADKVWPYGALVGLGYYGIGLAWLCKLSWMIGPMILLWFVLLFGFSFRVARLLMDRYGPAAMIWAVPLAFVGQEVLRSEAHGRFRFAFLAWGYSQAHDLWVAQIASLGGVYFLSFLLVMVNAAVAYALIQRRLWAWLPAAGVAAAVLVLGAIAQPRVHEGRQAVPVACVQAEILGYMQYHTYVERAARNEPRPAIIVMPEHALLDMQPEGDLELKALADLAVKTGTFICAAGDARMTRPGEICPSDNEALLIGPAGGICLKQLKAVPLPFFRDGNPASYQDVAPTRHGILGIYICYDGTFTDIPRRLVNLGAEVLLGPVMDPQPWPAQERWQHADLAIFRAIELRRCIVRAASSGISQIIDATGRVTAIRTGEEGPGLLFGQVYPVNDRTLFVRAGWLFAPAACIAFLAITAALTAGDWGEKVRRRYTALRRLRRRQSLTTDPMALLAGAGYDNG